MAPQLRILANVMERLRNFSTEETGHLYGIMCDDTLTVLTFSINAFDDTESSVNHTMMQLNMPAEVYLCGVLHVNKCEEQIPDTFMDIDITDNPLLLTYLQSKSKVQAYFYVHQKLKEIDDIKIIEESDIYQEFTYIRLQGSLALVAQSENVLEALEESRKNIALGKIGFNFPANKTYLLGEDDSLKSTSVKNLLGISEKSQGTINTKKHTVAAIPDVVHANMFLKISGNNFSEDCVKYAPVLQHVKKNFNGLECKLDIDTLSLVSINMNASTLHAVLVEAICRNIKLIEQSLKQQLDENGLSVKLPIPLHFKPHNCGHFFTTVYPKGSTDADTAEYRQILHKVLALDMTKPSFRNGNAIMFDKDLQKNLILNPHEAILQNDRSNGKLGIVHGLYTYHHYMQDNFDDNGWGCAYRSLQTIVSWYRLQGYTEVPIPSHHAIQKCLADIGDKPSSFIGSRQWIGSMEVGFVLETLLGAKIKVLCASTGDEVSTLAPDLLHHFQTQGTPVMIGGGVLAHTILGVNYDEMSGDVKFLILDPHYTGSEHLPTIINKGWCGWKTKDFWKKDAFYNMCLPQRPIGF
ncbi:hypothetical protein KM043_005097 [Ampulex compressa]|nr:hypothetical protein KM043_005097 [Ampulex compressa]